MEKKKKKKKRVDLVGLGQSPPKPNQEVRDFTWPRPKIDPKRDTK